MLAKRLAAVVLAVGLVVGALLLRRSIDGDGETATDAPSTTGAGGAPLTLVCDPLLVDACETAAGDGVTVVVEDAGRTLTRLTAADAEPVLWATLAPWPAIVDRYRSDDRIAFAPVGALASSPLTIVGRTERLAALEGACGAVSWTCLGDEAGRPWDEVGGQAAWGEVKPAHDDPTAFALGLLVLADAVVDHEGTADLNSLDLQVDDDLLAWLDRLENAALDSVGNQTALQRVLTPEVDATGAPAAVVDDALGVSVDDFLTVDGGRFADVVLAADEGADVPDSLVDDLRAALLGAGWDPPRQEEPGTGLPSADVMITLQNLWKDST